MKKIGDYICKHKILILILTLVLLIPAIIGMALTKINYDILVYLPEDIETIKGQDILTNDFNMGAFSVTIIDNMSAKDILKLEDKIRKVEGVAKVISAYDLTGSTIPLEMLPDDLVGKVKKDNSDIMIVTFNNSTSHEATLNAIEEIKEITKEHCKVGGMSAMVLDTMNLSEQEITIYVVIAVILCLLVLIVSLDSYVVPVLLLLNIGIAILFNLGSNILLGEISYITKALVAVLQLGVTTDFSIFLYHSYENKKQNYKTKEEAMSKAINETFTSVVGSSLTTIAGFLVLCTMDLTLGTDLGLVMAKGVLLGVICVLTLFPSLLLVFDKVIDKTKHKNLLPKFTKLNNFVIKNYKRTFIIFLILLIPCYLANSKVDIYYKLDDSLPKTLDSIVANQELKDKFNIVSPEIILLNKDIKANEVNQMIEKIENVKGIDFALSFSKLANLGISSEELSAEVRSIFESDKYQMILINSIYDIATPELNEQISIISKIIKEYDEEALFAGEGPLMKDLVTISDNDFKMVNTSSIICILIIMLFVLKSCSLPILLISVIEFAIFINMSFSYFGDVSLPFVAPIVLGTIQLGATIDYAILMTTTYLKNRKNNSDKIESMKETLDSCVTSIVVSGLCFFGATFGVGCYSDLEMISSLCTLISRGALISMIGVIFILPSVLLIFDKLIIKTTKLKEGKKINMKKNLQKSAALVMLGIMCYTSFIAPVSAITKEETVYAKLESNGEVKSILATEHLINSNNESELKDLTDLENIINLNGEEKYTKNKNELVWETLGNDIFYQGSSTKEMPIKLDIKYYLNDEEKSLDEIIGDSGSIKIKLNYQNQEKHNVKVNGKNMSMYTPFVVITTSIIDSANNKNVNISNGKVINNGTKNIVVGLSCPGLSDSLGLDLNNMNEVEISFDTTKFELASIYSIATPKVISEEDLKIFDKLDTLYTSMNTLNSSIDEIEKGALALLEGSSNLDNGSNLIYENLYNVVLKTKELESGAIAVDKGLKEMLSTLKKVDSSLNISLNELEQLPTLIQANQETIKKLTPEGVDVEGSIKKLNEGISLLQTNIEKLNQANQELQNQLELVQTEEEKEVLTLQIETNKATISGLEGELAKNKTTLASLQNSYGLITLLTKNNEALTKILESTKSLSSQVGSLTTKIEDALKLLENGAAKVADGTSTLREGLELLTSKTKELSAGASKLNDGVSNLKNGITKFNKEGIKKLNNTVNSEVKETVSKIKALVKLGEEYETFTKINESDEGTTKFIMVVNAKSAPTEIVEPPKYEEKENIWTKIKNLFK